MLDPSVPTDTRIAAPVLTGSRGNYRWVVCGLLFLAATINYIDRQVISILKPTLQAAFGWSEIDYSDIVFAFQLAYAIGLLLSGRIMDRIGAKLGFAIAIVIWSLAAMAHAEAAVFGPAVAAVFALVALTYSASVAGFIVAKSRRWFDHADRRAACQRSVRVRSRSRLSPGQPRDGWSGDGRFPQ